MLNQLVQFQWNKHAVAINVGVTGTVEWYKMAFYNVHNPQCRWNSQATTFSGNQRYTCTHTKTMYDVCAHSSLPTSAILALGLLKKKEERWWTKYFFWISSASQAHFSSFKGLHQRGYYFREHLYSQTSLKAWDSEEKQAFSSRLPLSRHIARLATYPIDPGILISLYASAHHPYTTLATGEWMIFWPGEDTPVEVRSTECSRHLVSSHPLHVRLEWMGRGGLSWTRLCSPCITWIRDQII